MGRERDLGAVKTNATHLQSHLGEPCPSWPASASGRGAAARGGEALLGPLLVTGPLQPQKPLLGRPLSWSLGLRVSAAPALSRGTDLDPLCPLQATGSRTSDSVFHLSLLVCKIVHFKDAGEDWPGCCRGAPCRGISWVKGGSLSCSPPGLGEQSHSMGAAGCLCRAAERAPCSGCPGRPRGRGSLAAASWVKVCVEHGAGAPCELWCSEWLCLVLSPCFLLNPPIRPRQGWSSSNPAHRAGCWELGPSSSSLLCSLDSR